MSETANHPAPCAPLVPRKRLTAARRIRASALLTKTGQITGFQATQQIATTQIREAVVDIGAGILREALIARYRYR